MTPWPAIAAQLLHALELYGSCVCSWGYDLQRIGEACAVCRSKAAYEDAVRKEKVNDQRG